MDLHELIDLEAQIAKDETQEEETLRRRDRSIAEKLEVDHRDRDALLSAWLDALRERAPRGQGPGRTVVRGRRIASAALVLLGLLVGSSTALVLLRYDGSRPVNVMTYLWAVVGIQILLLGLLVLAVAISSVWPGALERIPVVGGLRATVRLAWQWATARAGPHAELLHRVRTRGVLYGAVEGWAVAGLSQSFGVAFNVGVVAAFVWLVAFTDLAFAWSTTLDVDAASFYRLLSWLSLPWTWVSSAVPTEELVALTRYSRLDGAYVGASAGRAPDPLLAGRWWPFLVAATLATGSSPAVWRGSCRKLDCGTPSRICPSTARTSNVSFAGSSCLA